MATFGQMLGRFQAQQKLAQRLSKAELGITGEEEKQDIKQAKAQYQRDVEKAEEKMKEKSEKIGINRLIGKGLSIGASFIPGVGPLASAAISAGLDYIAGESVAPYKQYIKGTLGDGLFYKQAREDYFDDLDATNRFIQLAAKSQRTANIVSAVSSGIGAYTGYDAIKNLGQEVKTIAGDKFLDTSAESIYGSIGYSSLLDPDTLIDKYKG